MVDTFDESTLAKKLEMLGQSANEPMQCVYCFAPARTIDHLNGLVENSRYTGHGHVVGNLVPCCERCNMSKGGKPWRDFAQLMGTPPEQIDRIATYESSAPVPVSENDLKKYYPDLMDAYERLRMLTQDMLRAADSIASEIQRLESDRLGRQSKTSDSAS
jgi:hypothetical protein